MPIFALFVVFGGIALAFRLMAGSFDGDRVENYVHEQGWTLIDRSWDPLGPGWFGEQNARIYQIIFEDQDGHRHQAHVKTSMLSGVYITNDRIVQRAEDPGAAEPTVEADTQTLKAENAMLRRRLRELENQRRP